MVTEVTQAPVPTNPRWALDPAHSSIEFAVKHMVIATVKGRFTGFDLDIDFDEAHPERTGVEARIDAASIDTKEPQRDAHLRSPDFLDAERFPHLVFRSRHIISKGDGRYDLAGDLTIRDVTQEVVLAAAFGGTGKDPWGNRRAGFSAEGVLNRKDFGLTWNQALETGGVLVGDKVKIAFEVELIERAG